MEAIGYVLLYFLRGELPWQGLRASNKKDKYDKIKEKKCNTPIEELCEGFPEEFEIYLKYCRSLKFEEKPDYCRLKKLFRDLILNIENIRDFSEKTLKFDWEEMEDKWASMKEKLKESEEDKEKEKEKDKKIGIKESEEEKKLKI